MSKQPREDNNETKTNTGTLATMTIKEEDTAATTSQSENPGTMIQDQDAAMHQFSDSSRMSTPAPKSPSPLNSHYPSPTIHGSMHRSDSDKHSPKMCNVPDPIGSSVSWGRSVGDGTSGPALPAVTGASVLSSTLATDQTSQQLISSAQIASKGGIRHNIAIPHISNAPIRVHSHSHTMSLSSSLHTPTPHPADPLNTKTPSQADRLLSMDVSAAQVPTPVTVTSSALEVSKRERAYTFTAADSITSKKSTAPGTYSSHMVFAGDLAGESVADRKQKRLQRNRESARLSRRRRKQYLEVLEDRVNFLCEEMDRGRREHVLSALRIVMTMRNDVIKNFLNEEDNVKDESGFFMDLDKDMKVEPSAKSRHLSRYQKVLLLNGNLSRTSPELLLAITFGSEYLKSLVVPPSKKFIMWLTLQNDIFYRGGRAASERLSAARIGEKLRSCGHTRVPPSNSMWPLFCNEVALSYDQEEKIRVLQREVISNQDIWLHRHTGASAEHILQSSHDAIVGLADVTENRGKKLMDVLTEEQKVKLLSWVSRKKKQDAQKLLKFMVSQKCCAPLGIPDEEVLPDSQRHDAANLYILHHRLSYIAKRYPRTSGKIFPTKALKKFGRRPAFESLATMDDVKGVTKKAVRKMSGDFGINSLKRCSSEMSCDGMEDLPDGRGFMKKSASGTSLCGTSTLTPEAAQSTCSAFVYAALGPISSMIPTHRLVRQSTSQASYIQPMNPTNLQIATSVPDRQQIQLQRQQPQPVVNHTVVYQNVQEPVVQFENNVEIVTPTIAAGQNQIPHTLVEEAIPSQVRSAENAQPPFTFSMPDPVPVAPISAPSISEFQNTQLLKTVPSAPTFSTVMVPSPLEQQGTQVVSLKEEMSSESISSSMQLENDTFFYVSNQMADDSLFELTEEDWAIGEGAFLD